MNRSELPEAPPHRGAVVAYNARALRAYQKCGFVIEGREREAAFVDGTRHDDVMMGLLDREFIRTSP